VEKQDFLAVIMDQFKFILDSYSSPVSIQFSFLENNIYKMATFVIVFVCFQSLCFIRKVELGLPVSSVRLLITTVQNKMNFVTA